MANPTVLTSVTAWAGFTRTTMLEALLKSRGLTLDSATGRMVAIATEQAEALNYLRRAWGDLNTTFPNTFSERTQTATWVAGDSMVALAADTGHVLAVRLGGVEIRPLAREDYIRLRRSDDEGGGIGSVGESAAYYRIVGTTSSKQLVLELFPTPADAATLEVDFVALPPALPDVDAAVAIPLWPNLQEWLLNRAKEIWASETGDVSLSRASMEERAKFEKVIDNWLEGTREYPQRIRWRYPNQASRRARRFPRG